MVLNVKIMINNSKKISKYENRWDASFPGFAWPKTTLQQGTEHGLTSEFGTESGGTRAL